MKFIPFITSIILLATAAQISANTCEKNFLAEGDPRNGAEFSTSTTINDLSSSSALGQLRGGAALQMVEQAPPMGTHRATVVQQFVISARRERVAV